MILNMKENKPLPIYGDGKNIRDWLYVDDHNSAVWTILNKGEAGSTYNIGGENEWENFVFIEKLCGIMASITGQSEHSYKTLIHFVKDRPGHDRRYTINCDLLKNELGWCQAENFESGLCKTARWYVENEGWVNNVRQGNYRRWIEKNYINRN
jgi:dTDP-glucose 4,6-dehydratase